MQSEDSSGENGTLGRIALKQVRVSRAEVEARSREQNQRQGNAANRLVPYLDLFARLGNDELSRLSRVPTSTVESLRQQIDEVSRALECYLDLLPRLNNDELARLSGAAVKTIRFWRLSRPRHLQGDGQARTKTGSQRKLDEDAAESSSSSSSSSSGRRASEESGPGGSGSFSIETEDG